ncbi:DNA primase [Chryseobacterium sp. Leaf180]|uniref:toprim domain-containing protein n=1 Tax=Chryseobacterium sp. Leaf180 TaxID=1736289 RepID=UPI0006FB8DC8|nr:toprim domain-containing protein [Chryseobacterium sp. Leaf180]KQR94208.1 DNA primase [Chryseobacterium sp. Leaf180]
MNCETIKKNVSIKTVLESFGRFPIKENHKTAFYFAINRDEKKPSLSVDYINNQAFDFGTGKVYDVIAIVQEINKCSVSDALKYLCKFEFSLINKKNFESVKQEKDYTITKVGLIAHSALIQYLQSRRVYEQSNLVRQIEYELNGQKYFGVGFFNNSGGIEIRNKYVKICLGKKDVTLIKNNVGRDYKTSTTHIAIFEGFFDFLTFMNLPVSKIIQPDCLILNSTVMLFKVLHQLGNYKKILLFLDNDINGKKTSELITNKYKSVTDYSEVYENFNDLNDFYKQQDSIYW